MDIKHESNEYYIDPYHPNHSHSHTTHHQHRQPVSGDSSGSGRQGSAGAGAGDAGFKCDYPGCSKTFTRKDHLVRHKANHSQQSHYCKICGRAFKRLDLLQRHEKRNICQETDFPRPKRRRSSSASSESDSQAPLTASTQSYTNPLPNATSFFSSDTAPLSATSILTTNPFDPSPNPTSLSFNPQQMQTQPMLDMVGHQPLEQNPLEELPGGYYVHSSQPPDSVLGFSTWPPESWETLFNDPSMPPYNDNTNLGLDMPFNSLTPRMQESAERGQLSLASAALVVKLSNSFPDVELNLNLVTESLRHYWSHVAPTFPFIHHGTFDLDTAPNELILMMIIVGSQHTKEKRDFVKVVARIRGVLVQNCGLEMPITTLQCFTLCHVYDTWYGTSDSQFTAQCLWPVMVAHSRRKGIGVTGKTDGDAPQEEEAWAAWAKEEERRRAVYCVLLMDTQLSAFWNQHVSRQLSIFAHNVALPCPRSQWDALTATDWFRVREAANASANTNSSPSTHNKTSGGGVMINHTSAYPNHPIASINTNHPNAATANTTTTPTSKQQKSGYLPGLHPEFQISHVSDGYSSAILSALSGERLPLPMPFKLDLDNILSVEMVFMGLMAIAWDCRTRGGMGIRFKDGTKHWRGVVHNSVIHLRAAWEELNCRHGPSIEMRDMRDTIAISIISVLSDIPMLQVAAGANQVSGSPIGSRQYADSRRRLKLWTKTDDSWTCLWQSMRYLKQALFADWGIYSPWAVYLTTLVVWGFSTASSGDVPPPSSNPHDRTEALLDRILNASTRCDIGEGLGDLIHTTATMIDSEEHGGGVMQREMASLLHRLVGSGVGSAGGGGRGRRASGLSNSGY